MCNTLTNLLKLNRINIKEKCDAGLLQFLANILFAYIDEVNYYPIINIQGFPVEMWDEAVERVISKSKVEQARKMTPIESSLEELNVTENDTDLKKMMKALIETYEDIIPVCDGVLDLFLCSLIKNGLFCRIDE